MASFAVFGRKRTLASLKEDEMAGTGSPSKRRSSRSTPVRITTPECRRGFDSSASIVLCGIHGTGKATLAMMASAASSRRVVDVENLWENTTGFSSAAYRKQFGSSNHSLRQEEFLRDLLQAHDRGAIIVCNGSFPLDPSSQNLLREYASSHPVIHVTRDLQSVYQYLGASEDSKLHDLLSLSTAVFRRCSNYEFYNLSETNPSRRSVAPTQQSSVPAFLTLKKAERTFFKFLSLVLASNHPTKKNKSMTPLLDPGHFPLSAIPLESRNYTCAVQVLLSDLKLNDADIEALEFGSDAFEIIVEPLQFNTDLAEDISKSVSQVRRSTVTPIIYHVMPTASNVRYSEASYIATVWHGMRTAPEFATIDLTIDEKLIKAVIASRGSTKIIGHLHAAVDWYNAFWLEKYDTAMRLGCSLVRFTRPAKFMDDNAAIQSFRNTIFAKPQRIPMICYNTGRAGRRSACFNSKLTPVIPDVCRNRSDFRERVARNPETSWLSVQEATHILYASFTYDPLEYYIVGATAGYSLSPNMHNAAYKTMGMPHNFQTIETPTLESNLLEMMQGTNFGGTAIGQPFKIEALALVNSLSRHAKAIGAINTIIPIRQLNDGDSIPDADNVELFQERNQAGPVKALYGDNTDWIGIRSCIRRGLSPANSIRSATTSGLVIGAGGMARAVVYAMLQLGINNIVIFNRTLANAKELIAHFEQLVVSADAAELFPSLNHGFHPMFHVLQTRDDAWPKNLHHPTVIVSAIPTHAVGTSPAPQFTLPVQWIRSSSGGVVVELAYRTLNSPLAKQVREEACQSWICLDGLDLLPEQGFAQFELFTGKRAPRRIMKEEVLRCWTDEQGNANPSMVRRRLEAMSEEH